MAKELLIDALIDHYALIELRHGKLQGRSFYIHPEISIIFYFGSNAVSLVPISPWKAASMRGDINYPVELSDKNISIPSLTKIKKSVKDEKTFKSEYASPDCITDIDACLNYCWQLETI